MAKDDGQLSAARRAYRSAQEVGNRQEEARWANLIGDILKNRGEYVEALKWLRLDFDISVKYLPEKHLLPTCQSLGEIHLRLHRLDDALHYQEILTKGLGICDEEEVNEDDDARSRLHHNLGNVYMELREWGNAREHIEKDILICKRIRHCQGEAKGYINLGELHYRIQKYEEAIRCYRRALVLAKSMEDETALVKQIHQNIATVKEAIKVMDELKKEDQNLKKLTRNTVNAIGRPHERKFLLQQNELLDRVIEKSSMIFAWEEKRIAKQLCDKEKLGDAYLVLGESYQKLRNFNKAIKSVTKSWETYNSIVNLEGEALAKISIGDILDCSGDWMGALNAFEESYRIAVEANLPSVQLSALENMHYSHMIRFNNVEESRRLQIEIDNLKQSKRRELERQNLEKKLAHADNCNTYDKPTEDSPKCLSKTTSSQQTIIGRKRRVILSDDEDSCERGFHKHPVEDVTASDGFKKENNLANSMSKSQDLLKVASECAISSSNPVNIEESTCSYKSPSTEKQCIMFRIDSVLINAGGSYLAVDELSIESLKVELACSYYLQLPTERRSKGLLPIIQQMTCAGKILESLEAFQTLENDLRNIVIEVTVNGWVPKRLMKLYIDFCEELSEAPNMKLLKKLYISEVEDEIIASECELQDISITPLLNALNMHKTVAMLDLSHNLLGNGTMEKLQQFFTSGQKYGDLTLDLHCNRFGPTALFQICECPVLFARLEVLNISGNRLTDACGSYLATILENCRGLSFSLGQLAKTSSLSRLMLGSTGIGTDGAIQLTESMFNGSQESVKLDLSYCGLMSTYIHKLNIDDTLISGIHELNLEGNPILQEGSSAIASLLMNPRCCLKVLVLNKCQLGLAGVLQVIKALSENDQLEELHLADNTNLEEHYVLQYDSASKGSADILQPNLSISEPSSKMCVSKEAGTEQPGLRAVNTDCNQLEVADSEDNLVRVEAGREFDDSCTSSCKKDSSSECQFIRELSTAISITKQLQLLDLSNNGFSNLAAEALYTAWSSRLGTGFSWRHIKDQIIHFSMEINKCCRVKPCCRRD
ncbi:hypothetical protein GH714_021245 [Hevea brasiliensis]|uniref:Protein TONSOKU n=1 Tax=Hevea brasiliensis TaxID=3981 RepID=A0A6A6K7L1_HEVBR|nr:hypothetical protein GH714_021245 [Hevea brasiliensis]